MHTVSNVVKWIRSSKLPFTHPEGSVSASQWSNPASYGAAVCVCMFCCHFVCVCVLDGMQRSHFSVGIKFVLAMEPGDSFAFVHGSLANGADLNT